MKTKTLLLTLALTAAGAATSMAQVYSQNAVGYINVTIKTGFNLISDQLVQSDRTIGTLLANAPDQTTVYKYVPGSGYQIINNDISGIGGWEDPSVTIDLGSGVFVYNPAAPFTATFVGEVPQGSLTTPIVSGFQIVSSKVPQSGLIQSALSFAPIDQDQVFQYNNPGGYAIYTYDLSGVGGWDPEPSLSVGEAVFLLSPGAHPTWNRTFTVN